VLAQRHNQRKARFESMSLFAKLCGLSFVTLAVGFCTQAQAQCVTCPAPQVVTTPVINQFTTVDQGWYLGRFLGRVGRRVFGTAPVVPQTPYAVGFAPTQTFVQPHTVGFAPSFTQTQTVMRPVILTPSTTCACSPCGCAEQTTFRPITMAPASGCDTCGSTVVSQFAPSASSGCASCNAGFTQSASYDEYYSGSNVTTESAPTLNAPTEAAPRTFRKEPTLAAPNEAGSGGDVGADETSANSFQPPQLWNPRDRVTQNVPSSSRPQVWQAVYRQEVNHQNVSQPQAAPTSAAPRQMKWVAGN
jgi:hypothetical protein